MCAQKGSYDSWPTDEFQQDVRGGVVAMTDRGFEELPNGECLPATMKPRGDPAETGSYEVVALHDHLLAKREGSSIDLGQHRRPERRLEDAHHRKRLLGIHAPDAAALKVADRKAQSTWPSRIRESCEFSLQ